MDQIVSHMDPYIMIDFHKHGIFNQDSWEVFGNTTITNVAINKLIVHIMVNLFHFDALPKTTPGCHFRSKFIGQKNVHINCSASIFLCGILRKYKNVATPC